MPIERNNSFHLLLSDDELTLLKLLAERDGLNASDYLRMLIRMMPSTTNVPNVGNLLRLGATLGAIEGGKIDLAKLLESRSDAPRSGKPAVDEGKRKKAK